MIDYDKLDKLMELPVSEEMLGAYMEGNLYEDEMNRIDTLVSTNPDMEELVAISDKVDEDIQVYMQDEFAYEADMTALEDCDFDLPNLEADLTPHIGTDTPDYREVACAADATDRIRDIDETNQLNGDDNEIGEDEFGNDDFITYQDDDSFSTISANDRDNAHEPSGFPIEDDFFLNS